MEGTNQPVVTEGKHKIEDGNTFNLKWLVSTVLAIWPWLLGSIIISLILGNLYLRYTTPFYRSYAELLIADSKGGSGGAGNDMMDMLKLNNKKINIDNEIEIIKSRTTMLKVAKALRLNVNYSIVGRLKTTQIYNNRPFDLVIADQTDPQFDCKVTPSGPDTYDLLWNGKSIHGRWGDTIMIATSKILLRKTPVYTPDKITYTINVWSMYDAALNYTVDINLPNKNASYITLSMIDALPERSIDIINKLMEVYTQTNVQSRNRISDSTMNFITQRIKIVDTELTSIEMGIEEFKKKNGIANMTAQSEQLVDANQTTIQNLSNQEVELAEIDAVTNYMQKADKADEPIILPGFLLENSGMSDLRDKYNALQIQIEENNVANAANNPITKTLIKQRNDLRQNIIATLVATRQEIQLKVDKTNKELGNISGDIREVPKVERLFLEYSRKQAIKQDLFIFLLKKREETAIEKAATVPDASSIDPATTNYAPVLPNHGRVLMISFLLGTIIPFGIIMLRRALNIKIINKSDILKLTTIPIIGEIGNNVDNESIAVKRNSRTIIAEQFRALRTNLQYLLTDQNDKILMITSSMSGEGKSFIAVNTAITLAMSGKRVVLMELDLRKPKISKMLNMDNSVGFSTYSIHKAEANDIIVPSGIDPNLYIIPSGPIPPNPSELILLQRTEDLFHYLRANFDYVILDTSPVGLVTDAQLLHRYADTTLYIVRQGHTYKQQLNIPNELFHSGKITRLSLIVNDVVANRGFAYGYGYEEGYGYGYGGYGYGGYGYGGYGGYGNGYYAESGKKKKKGMFKRKDKEK